MQKVLSRYFLILPVIIIVCTGLPALSDDGTHIQLNEKKLNFYVNYSRFKYSDSLTYVEYPIDLMRDQLEFVEDEDAEYKAEYLVTAEIIQDDSVIQRKHWRNVDHCASRDDITPTQHLYNKNYFLLPEGDYIFRIEVEDANSGRIGTWESELSVRPFKTGSLSISDIQLASDIKKDTTKSLYSKNGYLIIPNPSALYGIGLPVLLGYSEVYHLVSSESDSGRIFRVNYHILDAQGEVTRTQTQDKWKPGESAVNIIQLNVVSLVSGVYTLVMEVIDLETGAETSNYRKFLVYRQPDYEEGGALSEKSGDQYIHGDTEIDGMLEQELNQEFDYARYLAASDEKKTFKKANLEGKREFLKQFWNRRTMVSQDLEVGENFRDNYLARVEMANQMFRGSFRDGWKTDRGRVLLIYGKPDDIERSTFGMGSKSHEIWHYHSLEGGVIFVFVDKQELGDMELVHSTARGELYDAGWERWLE
ncbi:GWxTD domain-containing protein [bacterium]|nr:GWxTD domain-containing protein [bacterium]